MGRALPGRHDRRPARGRARHARGDEPAPCGLRPPAPGGAAGAGDCRGRDRLRRAARHGARDSQRGASTGLLGCRRGPLLPRGRQALSRGRALSQSGPRAHPARLGGGLDGRLLLRRRGRPGDGGDRGPQRHPAGPPAGQRPRQLPGPLPPALAGRVPGDPARGLSAAHLGRHHPVRDPGPLRHAAAPAGGSARSCRADRAPGPPRPRLAGGLRRPRRLAGRPRLESALADGDALHARLGSRAGAAGLRSGRGA